jgi:rod shape-determining protein MreD
MRQGLTARQRRPTDAPLIDRKHSAIIAYTIPTLSILIASLLPQFVITAAIPYAPPLGLMMFIAWRLVRPGLLPVWAGFPLGAFDDLWSGQPFGSAILLWSLAMLAIEMIDVRLPWRTFLQDWFTASLIFAAYAVVGCLISGAKISIPTILSMGPQIVFAILLFPVAARIAAKLDRLRLTRWRRI